jgi:hypothetical protein
MTQPLLIVAKGASKLNKFEKGSLQEAVNLRDFLEQTEEFDEVRIFQLRAVEGPRKEWVSLVETEP